MLGSLGHSTLIDVRSPQEYTGERTHMPDYPEEGALRGGHIPTAVSVPWAKAADDSGRFRSRAELRTSTPSSSRATTSSPTAASVSGPATPGSC